MLERVALGVGRAFIDFIVVVETVFFTIIDVIGELKSRLTGWHR